MRPSHLHMMIHAPGFRKLTTALYPEGDVYLTSDPVFGVKKSLVVVRPHPRLIFFVSGELID
jgi:protocatechuate 3,4-dioxygenase beta subunit